MRIIISPAKKMRVDTDSLPWRDIPAFLPETEVILNVLKEMCYEDLKKLWKCNDVIASVNAERIANMNLKSRLTPALLSYEGIQYRYMAPGVFTNQELEYVQEHLRILSGFYGILKPLDGVVPYRLEMQAKVKLLHNQDLYDYWGNQIAEHIFSETDCVVNLAAKEYSVCVSRYAPKSARIITCIFGEEKAGKVVEKGTLCKMARGEMVRYMAEKQITDPEQMKLFDRLGYEIDEERSDAEKFVYIKKATES